MTNRLRYTYDYFYYYYYYYCLKLKKKNVGVNFVCQLLIYIMLYAQRVFSPLKKHNNTFAL